MKLRFLFLLPMYIGFKYKLSVWLLLIISIGIEKNISRFLVQTKFHYSNALTWLNTTREKSIQLQTAAKTNNTSLVFLDIFQVLHITFHMLICETKYRNYIKTMCTQHELTVTELQHPAKPCQGWNTGCYFTWMGLVYNIII